MTAYLLPLPPLSRFHRILRFLHLPYSAFPRGKRIGPFEVPAWEDGFLGYKITLTSPNWAKKGKDVLILEAEACFAPADRWVPEYKSHLSAGVWRETRRGNPTKTSVIKISIGAVQGEECMVDLKTHPADRLRFWLTALRWVDISVSVEGLP